MIKKETIEICRDRLSGLSSADAVADWSLENRDLLSIMIINGYGELIHRLNQIPNDSNLLRHMPKTSVIKSALGNTALPPIQVMAKNNLLAGLAEAEKPMQMGQNIADGTHQHPTDNEKFYAIGTPTMKTGEYALAMGTAGHILERTFFQWARKQGLKPKNGWEKDDWLQALDEGLLLMIVEGKAPLLATLFVTQNENDGLGWLNSKKVEEFRSRLLKLS